MKPEEFATHSPPLLLRADGLDCGVVANLVRAMTRARRGVGRVVVRDWILRFIGQEAKEDAKSLVEGVIDALCELGDVGHGQIRGEPVLFALPERRVALPDGRIVGLGDHGRTAAREAARDPHHLLPELEGPATMGLPELLDLWGDAGQAAGWPPLAPSGRWSPEEPPPGAVRRALMLCGGVDPVRRSWSVSPAAAEFLNGWFGLAPPESGESEACKAADEPDEEQRRIVGAPISARLAVEAGPGSGKTQTACARAADLVAQGAAPSRILLLSFTRVAAAELGARLDAGPSGVRGVQVMTLDSFAARLPRATFSSGAGGYEAAIRAAARSLRSGDPFAEDRVGALEHILIDEAQDLVGPRRELCAALLDLAHPECGITIFGDSAQAIYGYQDRGGETLLDLAARRPDFTKLGLERNRRMKTEALRRFSVVARDLLKAEGKDPRETFFDLRSLIEEAAVERVASFRTHASTTRGLILTRSRAGLLAAAEALREEGRRFRIRLPDRPVQTAPWIGALLGGLNPSTRISREIFGHAFEALDPPAPLEAAEAWEVLRDLDGSGRAEITVERVAEGLQEPPPELLRDHQGVSGPLLSTIHGVKGRQAARTTLLIPVGRREDADWGEEARILYVGATRASHELRVGREPRANFFSIGDPERHWRPRAESRELEIGLDGDLLDWRAFRRACPGFSDQEIVGAVWRAARAEARAEALPESASESGGRLMIHAVGGGAPLGRLSPDFVALVEKLAGGGDPAFRPPRLSGFSVVGATTVTPRWRETDALSLALSPLLGGFAAIPR